MEVERVGTTETQVGGKADSERPGSTVDRPVVSRRGRTSRRRSSSGNPKGRGTGARKTRKVAKAKVTSGNELDQDRPHHPYSPSWLQSGEACPCYRSKDSKHVRTIAGTIAHKSAEKQEDDDNLSDEDAVAVAECLDFYDKKKQEMESEGMVFEGTETYLPIDDLKFPDCEATTAGYVDRWLLNASKTHGKLIDWKFGKWPVEEAANNLQGMAYAMGLFRKFPTLETVEVFFKQPLIDYLTSHTFTRADIAAIYLRIQVIVERARAARAKCEKGDWSDARPAYPLCNFCDNLGKCTKVLAFACKVGHKFHPLGIPAEVSPTLILDSANTKLAMELAAVLKIWGDAFRRQVTDRVMRGDAVMPEGYGPQTIQKRELVSMENYKKVALRYLNAQEWESCLDTTFSAVEKKIALKAPRGVKETTVKEFQAQAASEGATKLGEPISFLKVVSEKPKQQS